MSIEKETISGLKWTGLSKLLSQLISWTMTLVVLRILAPSDYGLMAILSVIIGLLSNVTEFGLGMSLVQARNLTRRDIEVVTGIVVVANVGIAVLLTLTAPLAALLYAEPRLMLLTRVAALQFLFGAVSSVPQALAYREMKFRWLAIVELMAVTFGGLSTILLAWRGAGVWALLLGMTVQSAIRAALLSQGRLPRPTYSLSGARAHFRFGAAITVFRLASQLVNQSDIIIASRILGEQAVGLYSVSLHFATLPMQKIMGTVNQVAFPAVSRLQDDRPRLRIRMLGAIRLMMSVTVPMLWGMSATARELVQVVLGPKWTGAVHPLQAVCLIIPLQMLTLTFSTAATGVRDLRANYYNLLASAIVLPVAFFTGAKWGIDGLAYAWLVAVPAVLALRLPATIRTVGVTPGDVARTLWKPVSAAAVMYLVVSITREASLGLVPAFRLGILVAVGAAAYVIGILLVDRTLVHDIRRATGTARG